MRGRPRRRRARAAPHGPLTRPPDGADRVRADLVWADLVWYGGYGSNTLPERLVAYLAGSAADGPYGAHPAFVGGRDVVRTAWTTTDRRLYFAGRSVRWDGAVAFLGLRPEPGAHTHLRLHLVTSAQLAHVATVENNVTGLAWDGDVRALDVGASRRLDLPRGLDPRRAKYDTVLRLPDHDGHPVATLTTSRDLEPGEPGAAYRAVVAAGLADGPPAQAPGGVAGYLDAAVRWSTSSVSRSPGRTGVSAAPSNTCSD